MTRLSRRLPVLFVFVTLLGALLWGGQANAQRSTDLFQFQMPSPSGSFLAGQEALAELRTPEAARFLLDATTEEWDNPAVIERAFAALTADGRVEDAESLAKRLLELAPNHDLAQLVIGTVALKERRYTTVVKLLDGMGFDNFVGITAAVVKAWAEVGLGNLDAAFADLDELDGSGLESFLVFHRALMADVAGDERAIGLARQAYDADPLVAHIVEAYARMLGDGGQIPAALEVVDTYESSGFLHPAITLVRDRLVAGRQPGKFVDTVPAGATELFHRIGSALARDGASDIALVFLQLGRYLEPQSDEIALTIGQLYDNAEQHDYANAVYDSIPATSPYKSEATVAVAENLDAMGDHEEAIRRLGNMIAVQPDNLSAISSLGDMLRLDEQFERAIETYTMALDLSEGDRPNDWRFYYVRGIAYERDGEWDKAESDLQRALELNPGQPAVLNYLGYSWVDQGLHLDEALDMIEQAVSAAPRDGYIVDSLGWAYYKLRRYDEAVDVMEEAARLLPNDPEINDHLGDVYWAVGRQREARFQWTIARDVDERGDVTARVGPKLENGLPEPDKNRPTEPENGTPDASI